MSFDKNFIYLLFTPFIWYKIVSLIFYGVGPSAYYFGNDITVTFMHNYYFTSNETLYKIINIYLIIILSIDLLMMIYNSIFDLNFKTNKQNRHETIFVLCFSFRYFF